MSTHKNSVYIIAEAGVNHNGCKELAFDLVAAAANAGADAVKFQTFNASRLASKTVEKAQYQYQYTDKQETQLEMLSKLELPESWHVELQEYAHRLSIEFLSTAFDDQSLAFLCTLNLPIYKIPSGELTNGPLLWRFAQTKKPLILSTGMATLSEVEQALAIIHHGLHGDTEPKNLDEVWACWSDGKGLEKLLKTVTLLHCTSQYPTPWSEVNLKAMDTLSAAFGIPIGYSDHTAGTIIPIAAVARGAKIIEKHMTLDKNLPGPDHNASLEMNEFKQMVEDIRALELALGSGLKAPQLSEWDTRKAARQSIIAARYLPLGKTIESADLTTARIGHGISPARYWDLIGSKTQQHYEQGDVIEL